MALKISQKRCFNSGIKIKENFDTNLKVRCNDVGLAQVMLNLIVNSIDAIEVLPEKWISIATEFEKDLVRISVTDSGSGIPDEIASKMNQPFFTTKGPKKGTGLGLSISKKFIEKMSGSFYYNAKCPNTQFVIEFKNFER